MSATIFGEWEIPNYKGGDQRFNLQVGENDGIVFIALGPAGVVGPDVRIGSLEVSQARELLAALDDAISRAAHPREA